MHIMQGTLRKYSPTPKPQNNFLAQKIKVFRLLVKAFKKIITSCDQHGCPFICKRNGHRVYWSGNMNVWRTYQPTTILGQIWEVSKNPICAICICIFSSARTSYRTFDFRPVPPVRPQEKSRSPLQPYNSSQDHCQPIKPYIFWKLVTPTTQ